MHSPGQQSGIPYNAFIVTIAINKFIPTRSP